MFEKITPEKAGIKSENIIKFIKMLEKRGLNMHGILLMKDDKIVTEAYWAPFDKDFCHRMYSQTKSFVSVAIGLLQDEGKLSIKDKIVDYFPEKIGCEMEYINDMTIENLLTMSTCAGPCGWFGVSETDRTKHYFSSERKTHPSGTNWSYDSSGSQVLSSLVEKLAQKPLLDYLKEKIFDKTEAFKTATILKAPNGDSWGDSAMICTLRDMVTFGRFVMNYGTWNGERLISEEYLRKATSKVVDNRETSNYSTYHQGYGYQIWRVCSNGFAFVGMGDQLTICYPDKNLIFACVADNQGNPVSRELILIGLEEFILDEINDTSLDENLKMQNELENLISTLSLRSAKGLDDSEFRPKLNDIEYICEENRMGISKFSFHFNDDKTGEFRYKNEQGEKIIPFGINHNVFGKFPQFGYSNEYGRVKTTDGFMYDDAVSFAWLEEQKIQLFVQVIDKYFGNMNAIFGFKGDDAYAVFTKNAEDFLDEYCGDMVAHKGDSYGTVQNR